MKYKFSKKKYTKEEVELLNPYKSITKDGLIETKDGKFILPIEVKGNNVTIMHQSERSMEINKLREVLMKLGVKFSFSKVMTRESYEEHHEYLRKLKSKYSVESKLHKANTISEESLTDLERKNLNVTAAYIFYLYGDEVELLDKKMNIFNAFKNANLKPRILNTQEIRNVISPFFKHISIRDKGIDKNDLSSLIMGGVEFKHNYIKSSGGYFKIVAISTFPDWSNDGWLYGIANNDNANFIMNIEGCDSQIIKAKIDKVIRSLRTTESNKESQESTQNRYINGLVSLSESLQDKERVFKTTSLIIINARNATKLSEHTNAIREIAEQSGLLLEEMDYLQKEAWSATKPKTSTPLKSLISLEIPSYVLAQTFIFSKDYLNDEKGMYLGYSSTDSNIFLDLKVKTKTRISHALTIIASKGSGKSTIIKKIMKDQYMQSTRVIGIDYEREYAPLCNSMGGDVINFGTDLQSESKVLNPLQFYFDVNDDADTQSALTTHVNFLKTFFEILLPELEQQHLSLLEDALLIAYSQKNIHKKIISKKEIKNKDFPTMEDVYKIILKESIKTKRLKHNFKHEWYLKLEILFKTFITKGTPQNALWGYHTNFDFFDSEFMIMDTHSLIEGRNNKLNAAQYFVMLNHVIASARRQKAQNLEKGIDKSTMFAVDEAHIFFETIQAAKELARLAKRARKYNLILVLATQDFADFSKGSAEHVAEKMKIISNSQYKFILSMKPSEIDNLDDSLKSIGGLSENEKTILYEAEQGEGVLTVNAFTKLNVTVDISPDEMELWEKGL